jgi:hypothetical protein
MRILSIALVSLILVISFGCAGKVVSPVKSGTDGEVTKPFVDECVRLATSGNGKVPGWKLASPVETYDEESIFNYIDGAAELYFAYDFRAVAAAEYQNGETSIIVDVYDMTTPEGAFGIYSLNRYSTANYVDIGNEGIMSGTNLDFWKGRYFCKVYSFDMSEKYQDDVVSFGDRLASEILEAGEEPAVLGLLPQNSLIPGSARFFSRKLGLDNIRYVSEENVFNLSEETKGVVAEYQVGDSKFDTFVILYPSPDKAFSAFEKYSNYLAERNGQLLSAETANTGTRRIFEVDGKFTSISLKDQRLMGFWDVDSQEIAETFSKDIG